MIKEPTPFLKIVGFVILTYVACLAIILIILYIIHKIKEVSGNYQYDENGHYVQMSSPKFI